MIAPFAFFRAIAQIFISGALFLEGAAQPDGGSPDKSSAVCHGAAGRFGWGFGAALYPPRAAFSMETSMRAPIHAPSPIFGPGNGNSDEHPR